MASAKDYSPFVPFDLYDFFGYLFPGILFAASMFLFMSQFNFQDVEPLKSTLTAFRDPPFIMSVAIVACGIVVLYVLGHFVATISHIIIDRVLIDGIEGYPINFLLNIPRVTRGYSESTYKYLFALYNLLLILPVIVGDYSTLHFLLKIVLGSIAFLILQRIVIMLVRTTKAGKARAHTLGDYWVFRIFLVPSKYLIDPLIGFFRRLLGLDRRFSDSFIAMYKDLFHQRFSPLLADDVGSDNYWLPALHAISRNPSHEKMLQTWLHLYGFARNASAAFYLGASLIIGHLYFNPQTYTTITRVHLGILWLLSVVLGIRYWILYSHYYSKGVIRAFVESASYSDANDESKGGT